MTDALVSNQTSEGIPAADRIASSLFIRQLLIRLIRDTSIDRIRNAPVYHLGLFREKATLQPVECENSRLGFFNERTN